MPAWPALTTPGSSDLSSIFGWDDRILDQAVEGGTVEAVEEVLPRLLLRSLNSQIQHPSPCHIRLEQLHQVAVPADIKPSW
jgi:hypothetical protein